VNVSNDWRVIKKCRQKNTLHRAVSLRQHGFLVIITDYIWEPINVWRLRKHCAGLSVIVGLLVKKTVAIIIHVSLSSCYQKKETSARCIL